MSLLTFADRVAETTTVTGTGTVQLNGAVDAKFRTFVAGVGSGNTVPYVIVHRTANEWESGYGVVTAGSPDTLTRGGVYASSTGGAVSFTAGTKDVFLALPGTKTVRFDDATSTVSFSGNVGIGVTPTNAKLEVVATSGEVFRADASGGAYRIVANQTQVLLNGNVGIGTVSPATTLDVRGVANALQARFGSINTRGLEVSTVTVAGTTDAGTVLNARGAASGTLIFQTEDTERARITAGGYLKASNDGTYASFTGPYHELRSSETSSPIVYATHKHASQPYGIFLEFTSASPDNNTNYFLRCADSTTNRLFIYSDGDVLNHDGVYGTISDAKLKQDVVDAGSQWDDLKAIRFRKYRFISDVEAKGDDAPVLLGVVAQELQATSPGLVEAHPDTEQVEVVKDVEVIVEKSRPVLDENGEPVFGEDGVPLTETYTETETRTETTTETRPTGTETLSVKSSVLLMKAAKALQEAMARIESLEARLAVLESAA